MMEENKMRVFLGGTCGNSVWRQEVIKLLNKGIACYNPVVDVWNEEHRLKEVLERETCNYIVYTLTKEMVGVYSIAEVVDDSNKRPENTLLCILEEGFDQEKLKSIHAVVKLIEKNGVDVFYSIYDLVRHLNMLSYTNK